MVITVLSKAQIERLARHNGVSQKQLLARVLTDAERMLVDGLSASDRRAYYRSTE